MILDYTDEKFHQLLELWAKLNDMPRSDLCFYEWLDSNGINYKVFRKDSLIVREVDIDEKKFLEMILRY